MLRSMNFLRFLSTSESALFLVWSFTGKRSKSPSNVKSPTGWVEPLTVTLSICLRFLRISSEQAIAMVSDTRIETSNCLVAASSLEAMLTWGER